MSNDLQKRLYEFEVNPPSKAWDKIAAALDESHLSDEFPVTLYNLEATPPATAWEKISSVLGETGEEQAPVRRMFRAWRYAAAAVVIGAIALGSVRLLSGNSEKNDLAEQKTTVPVESLTNPPKSHEVATVPGTDIDPVQEARNDAALEESKHLFASLDATEKQRIKRVSEEHFLSLADPISSSGKINPVNTYRDAECAYVNSPSFAMNDDNSPIDMVNRYVMLMTPDGHIIRISKKLGPLVCCVSGEDEDEDCNNQLKKWREKLASPATGASAGNFLDILNLIHSFRENNP